MGELNLQGQPLNSINPASIPYSGRQHFKEFSSGAGADIVKANSEGFFIGADNFTEAPFKVTYQGAMTANSGTFGGALEVGTDALHVDINGNMWWGSSTTYAGATIKISSAGVAALSGAIISGNVTITGGSGISNLSDAGNLAVLDTVGASNVDTTIISGGKIITGLLTASNIQTGTLNASVVSVTNINATNINTGTLTGIVVQSTNSASGSKVRMSSGNSIDWIYDNDLKAFAIAGTSGQLLIESNNNLYLTGDEIINYYNDDGGGNDCDWYDVAGDDLEMYLDTSGDLHLTGSYL